MKKIAFVCVHNSCRSQIAEVLCKIYAGDQFDTYSAGTDPVYEINSSAIRLMKTYYGIDMTRQKPKTISELPQIDILVTMGCEITCPTMPVSQKISWRIDDPNGKSDEEFLAIIHTISDHVRALAETMHYD
ncbi:MAG: arsenate reductase ArsC [Methanocalculaceae archaeon]|nr:arsenate reductase ArsC [Methanocalculaceae archaeon]